LGTNHFRRFPWIGRHETSIRRISSVRSGYAGLVGSRGGHESCHVGTGTRSSIGSTNVCPSSWRGPEPRGWVLGVRCDPSRTCVRDGDGRRGPAAPPDQIRCSLEQPTFGSEPAASFGQMTVVTSRERQSRQAPPHEGDSPVMTLAASGIRGPSLGVRTFARLDEGVGWCARCGHSGRSVVRGNSR
jgi:hypothetical protein